MRRARAPALIVFALACGAPAAAAPIEVAARDSGGVPGLGEVEQFPLTPRAAPPAPPVLAQPAAPQPQSGNPLWAVPLRSLSATRERPIFSPSRRPPPEAVVVAPAEPTPQAPRPVVAERPSLALVGTIVGEGESIAIFYNPTTKMTIRLRLGQTDDTGWKLVAVDARTTLLEKDRRSVTLALPAPGETPTGVPAPQRGGSIPGGGEPDL